VHGDGGGDYGGMGVHRLDSCPVMSCRRLRLTGRRRAMMPPSCVR
jgi:hypothetical protein